MSEKWNQSARTRAPNFTKEEQALLLDVMKAFTHIIECKQPDGVKQRDKQRAWVELTEVFNANTNNLPRTTENLISCYRNLKSKMKKGDSMTQIASPCQKSSEEVTTECTRKKEDNKVKEITESSSSPPKSAKSDDPKVTDSVITGVYAISDRDALLMSHYEHESIPDEEEIRHIKDEVTIEACDYEPEWPPDTYTSLNMNPVSPTVPKEPRLEIAHKKTESGTPVIKRRGPRYRNKNTVKNSFQQLSRAKLELVELQKRSILMDIEHKSKIQEIEIEELIKQNKHKDQMREKELQLMEFKIKKESLS